MKRILGRVLTVVATGVFALVLTPACAENDQTIYIRHMMAPPINRQNNTCLYLPDPTQPFISEGTLDVAVADSYVGRLLVGSQLLPRGDQTNTRAESNRAHLNGAVVRVTDPGGATIAEFTSTGTGFVDPQAAGTPSFGLLAVTAIDTPTALRIVEGVQGDSSRLVLANIKAFGTTLGGVDLESGEFQFPIRVCRGCLVSFATGDDPATPGVDCSLPLSTTSGGAQIVLPCRRGQDEVTPCQLCTDKEGCRSRQ